MRIEDYDWPKVKDMSEKINPTLTEIEDKETRSSTKYWNDRVAQAGNHKSPFLDKPQEEIDAFTARHRKWVEPWVKGKGVLEIGCGYGRTMDMFAGARSYVGIDCVSALVEEAREKIKEVFPKHYPRMSHARHAVVLQEDLSDFSWVWSGKKDICVAISVISSVEPFFHDLRRKILNALRPSGVILWLEEDYTRVDYK